MSFYQYDKINILGNERGMMYGNKSLYFRSSWPRIFGKVNKRRGLIKILVFIGSEPLCDWF